MVLVVVKEPQSLILKGSWSIPNTRYQLVPYVPSSLY